MTLACGTAVSQLPTYRTEAGGTLVHKSSSSLGGPIPTHAFCRHRLRATHTRRQRACSSQSQTRRLAGSQTRRLADSQQDSQQGGRLASQLAPSLCRPSALLFHRPPPLRQASCSRSSPPPSPHSASLPSRSSPLQRRASRPREAYRRRLLGEAAQGPRLRLDPLAERAALPLGRRLQRHRSLHEGPPGAPRARRPAQPSRREYEVGHYSATLWVCTDRRHPASLPRARVGRRPLQRAQRHPALSPAVEQATREGVASSPVSREQASPSRPSSSTPTTSRASTRTPSP